jgi:hypothetical protein
LHLLNMMACAYGFSFFVDVKTAGTEKVSRGREAASSADPAFGHSQTTILINLWRQVTAEFQQEAVMAMLLKHKLRKSAVVAIVSDTPNVMKVGPP